MSKRNPAWLPEARELCRTTGIKIAAWGRDTLVVFADSPERANQIAPRLAPLGFQPIEDEDDARAGLLTLSRNPAATRAAQREGRRRYGDFSRRPAIDRFTPLFEAGFAVISFWVIATQPLQKAGLSWALGPIFVLLFLWDGTRIWGWKLQVLPAELRVRRNFLWSSIPWTQIRGIDVSPTGRYQETVTLTFTSDAPLRLGRFGYVFARALRDYLREEMAERRTPPNTKQESPLPASGS